MNRKILADEFLEKIDDYLDKAGWKMDSSARYIDPITLEKHLLFSALQIQLTRDLI